MLQKSIGLSSPTINRWIDVTGRADTSVQLNEREQVPCNRCVVLLGVLYYKVTTTTSCLKLGTVWILQAKMFTCHTSYMI